MWRRSTFADLCSNSLGKECRRWRSHRLESPFFHSLERFRVNNRRKPPIMKLAVVADPETDVSFGSWLCENAKTLNRDRRSYSSKTVLVAQRASGFNLEIELKNIILRRVSIFEFSRSQGQTQKSECTTGKSALPRTADIPAGVDRLSRQPIGDRGMRGRLMSSMGSCENSDVQLAAACNGTTSVRWVPPVDSCLVNSAPS